MIRVRRRPRLVGVLAAIALALAPALPSGIGALAASSAPTKGYWFVAGDGGIFSFGDATFAGSTGNLKLNQPIVGMSPTPTGRGYWFVAADGGIFSFGDAGFFGSTGKLKLNRPIVGMAPTPTGRGYWFVAADGGIFSFGDAAFYGSTGAIKLAKPIVGMASTPTGRGYWFVASDGGIFNYGDAAFFGSAAGTSLRSPVISMTTTPSGRGYYLATADGTVIPFGDAVFKGSMGGKPLTSPIVGLAPTSTGAGYWLVAADGGIFSFGDAAFFGSTGNKRLNRAIVGMAAAPQKTAGGGTIPGGTNPGGTLPGGGTTDTTVPGGGTTPTTLPPANGVNWGPAGTTTIVAKGSAGGGTAFRPWMSQDGRYLVFDSTGNKVLNGSTDTSNTRHVYLYDRTTGAIERITNSVDGQPVNVPTSCSAVCGSQRATISADGRYVAFWSNATNLVAGDTNNSYDAFLYDRQNHTMSLVSKGFNGAQANGDSRRPVVSRDGSYVAFESAASNLIAPQSCGLLSGCSGGDKNSADDVFLYEVGTGNVTLVSGAAGGTTANGASNRPSLSGNGHRITYQSAATNLVSSDANGTVTDVFMKDLDTGQTTVISTNAAGAQSDKASDSPSISADGRWVSFDTKATNFNPADAGGDIDVYVKDLQTGAIDQASVQSGGAQATGTNGASTVGADSTISSDGRFVSFWSDASTLVPGDTNGSSCTVGPPCTDVFVRDRAANTTTRITSTNGVQGDDNSYSPALSNDGRFVAFDSKANTLDPSAAPNSAQDVFVHTNY